MFAVGEYRNKPGWFFDGSESGTPDLQKATLLHVSLRFDQLHKLEMATYRAINRDLVLIEPRPVDVYLGPGPREVGFTTEKEAKGHANTLRSLIDGHPEDDLGKMLQPIAEFLENLRTIR